MREQDEHENRFKKKCLELDAQVSKAKELHGRVVTAESRANEVQKKYDECKRNYFKLRDERERLRADLEKARGEVTTKAAGVDGTAGDTSIITTGGSSAKIPQNGTVSGGSDVQAQYESLKTKYRVSISQSIIKCSKNHIQISI